MSAVPEYAAACGADPSSSRLAVDGPGEGAAPADADTYKGMPDKFAKFFSPNPAKR